MDDPALRDCLFTQARCISRAVTGTFDQALRPFGVTASQFAILIRIAGAGSVSRADIGRASHQEQSTLSRNLQLILRRGWGEEVQPAKGRRRPITVTPAGRALLVAAMPAWRGAQEYVARAVGQEGAAALAALAASVSAYAR